MPWNSGWREYGKMPSIVDLLESETISSLLEATLYWRFGWWLMLRRSLVESFNSLRYSTAALLSRWRAFFVRKLAQHAKPRWLLFSLRARESLSSLFIRSVV